MSFELIPDKYVGKVTLSGNWGWSNSTLKSPMKLYPESLWSASKLPAFVKYEPNITAVGKVRISAYILGYDEKQDTNAEFEVSFSGGTEKINVDMSKYKEGKSDWLTLGTYMFDGSGSEYVKLNRISTENNTRASTVRFEIMNEAENSKGGVWQYLYVGPALKPKIYSDIEKLDFFADLENCKYKREIESLKCLGIIKDDEKNFYPDNKALEKEFSKWMTCIFDYENDCKSEVPLTLTFAKKMIATYVRNIGINLEWLNSNDDDTLLQSSDLFGKLNLDENITRAEAAALLYRVYHTFKASAVSSEWKLTFCDDFSEDNLNTFVWQCENKAPSHIQSSRWSKNVEVKDGVMSLKTVKEKLPDYPKLDWTTASVWVKPEVFSQCGGFWQASIKINKGKGINNAFWMIGDGNEIDIVEAHYKNNVHTNYHFEGIQYSENYSSKFDLSEDFHIYALEWTDREFIYYFDGKEISRKQNINAFKPLYPIFSTAVINWAGQIPDSADGSSMDVEWVRIYDKKR